MEKAEQRSRRSEEAALAMERGGATKTERRRGRWLLPAHIAGRRSRPGPSGAPQRGGMGEGRRRREEKRREEDDGWEVTGSS